VWLQYLHSTFYRCCILFYIINIKQTVTSILNCTTTHMQLNTFFWIKLNIESYCARYGCRWDCCINAMGRWMTTCAERQCRYFTTDAFSTNSMHCEACGMVLCEQYRTWQTAIPSIPLPVLSVHSMLPCTFPKQSYCVHNEFLSEFSDFRVEEETMLYLAPELVHFLRKGSLKYWHFSESNNTTSVSLNIVCSLSSHFYS
jgi:hypothetical protein